MGFSVVNDKTGEIVFNNAFILPQKAKIKEGFMMIFQEAFETYSKDKSISGAKRRVLEFLLAKMDYENEVYETQRDLAEELETTQQEISKSVRSLEEAGYIKIIPTKGTVYIYRINPNLAWKGSTKNREKALEDWDNE